MKKTLKLFYLDDDADDRLFFKEAAAGLADVVLYSNGEDMLQDLRIKRPFPDVIFLDVHMPILNGVEILNLLKNSAEYQIIPIVMISGAYPKKLVKHFEKVGANYLMKKPSSEYSTVLQTALAAVFETTVK